MSAAEHPDLPSLLDAFIEGREVKRAKLELRWHEQEIMSEFILALQRNGFLATTVGQTAVLPGERAPAFVLADGHAWFGWVFWEKFSERRMRKLFGSVVRNRKGDWELQITEKMPTIVYVNSTVKSEMDLDNPTSF